MIDLEGAKKAVARRAWLTNDHPGWATAPIESLESRTVDEANRLNASIAFSEGVIVRVSFPSDPITETIDLWSKACLAIEQRAHTSTLHSLWPLLIRSEATQKMYAVPRNAWAQWEESSRALLQSAEIALTSAEHSTPASLRVQRLAKIQAALGLPLQDLARVLAVSRPGLYKWLDHLSNSKLRTKSRRRLDAVERVTDEWLSRSRAPLVSVANDPIDRDGTVLDLLLATTLDERRIVKALDKLARRLNAAPSSLSERMAQLGFTRRAKAGLAPDDE